MRTTEGLFGMQPVPDPDLMPVPDRPRGLVARLDLRDVKPPVWRRLELSGDLTLLDLHHVIQMAMGWQNCHLHRFRVGVGHDSPGFLSDFDLSEGDTGIYEGDVRLDQVVAEKGDALWYEYDFGDGWDHVLKVEKVLEEPPAEDHCTRGRMACPPEDCGGIWGYQELADWVRSGYDDALRPDLFETKEDALEWLPEDWDPGRFDPESVNAALQAALAEPAEVRKEVADLAAIIERHDVLILRQVLASEVMSRPVTITDSDAERLAGVFQTFLDIVGDGVTLTGAGYLPPAVVEQVAQRCGVTEWWIGKANREDLTPPVALVRESAQQLRLVSVRKGSLAPTAAVRKILGNSRELLERIAERLPVGTREADRQAGWLTLALVAGGVPVGRCAGVVGELLFELGWRSGQDRFSPPPGDNPTLDVLEQLDATVPDLMARHDGVDEALAALARSIVLEP